MSGMQGIAVLWLLYAACTGVDSVIPHVEAQWWRMFTDGSLLADTGGEMDGWEVGGGGWGVGFWAARVVSLLWSFASRIHTFMDAQVMRWWTSAWNRQTEFETECMFRFLSVICAFLFMRVFVWMCEWCLWTSRCVFQLPRPSTIPHHCQIIPFLLPILPLLLDWTGRDNLGLERAVRPGVLLIHLDGADVFNIHRSSAVGLDIFHYISSQGKILQIWALCMLNWEREWTQLLPVELQWSIWFHPHQPTSMWSWNTGRHMNYVTARDFNNIALFSTLPKFSFCPPFVTVFLSFLLLSVENAILVC